MACACVGNLAIPPLFVLTCKSLGDDYSILPYLILILLVIMISCHEVINVKLSRRDRSLSPDERKKYETI